MKLLKSFCLFTSLLASFFSITLHSAIWSVGLGGGVTFYNNDFYLRSANKQSYKDMTNNVFGSNLQLYLGLYLNDRVRLDLNQNFRSRSPIQTQGYSFLQEDKSIGFSSSLGAQSTSLNFIYEISQSDKSYGFIGFGVNQYRNNLGEWTTSIIKPNAVESKQILEDHDYHSWSAKIIVGSAYRFAENYAVELSLAFSFIEFIETGSLKRSDFPSSENTGVGTFSRLIAFLFDRLI